jgi:uncharacterized protein YlxP (DUF503 family)
MVIGILEVTLAIPAASLKEKRSVIKRIVNRSRNKFNVSAAEVESQDHLSSAVLGFTAVGNDARFLRSTLDKLLNFIEELYLAEIVDSQLTTEHY